MCLLLAVGIGGAAVRAAHEALLAGGSTRLVTVPAAPSRQDLDAALDTLDGSRLVVAAHDGGLNAVVQRLYRRGESARVATGYVPFGDSPVARLLGLPAGSAAAARVAMSGRPVTRGLVRDDHGGVLLGEAVVVPREGRRLGLRAYVEDTLVADGMVRSLRVRPADGCLEAAAGGGLRRGRARGRAVTMSCQPAGLVVDGVTHPRPQTRRTWWYEADLWRVVHPA